VKKGFARGLVPERIIGASNFTDQEGKKGVKKPLKFLLKWQVATYFLIFT